MPKWSWVAKGGRLVVRAVNCLFWGKMKGLSAVDSPFGYVWE